MICCLAVSARWFEFELDLRRGAALALGGEVGAHLLDDMAVAAVELGVDDLLGIGLRRLAAQAPSARPPTCPSSRLRRALTLNCSSWSCL